MFTAKNMRLAAGWSLTALLVLAFGFSTYMKLSQHPEVGKELVGRFGYPESSVVAIGVLELSCLIIYLIPQTSVLGGVLLTGYMGGAIATHVRVGDGFIPQVFIGVLVWLSILLREPRLWSFLFWNSSVPSPTESHGK